MPKAMEKKLLAEAKKKFPGNKKRQDAYVYGSMRNTGWTPKPKGKGPGAKKGPPPGPKRRATRTARRKACKRGKK